MRPVYTDPATGEPIDRPNAPPDPTDQNPFGGNVTREGEKPGEEPEVIEDGDAPDDKLEAARARLEELKAAKAARELEATQAEIDELERETAASAPTKPEPIEHDDSTTPPALT